MSKPIKKLLASLLVMPVIVGLNSSLKLNKEEIRARALSGDRAFDPSMAGRSRARLMAPPCEPGGRYRVSGTG